MKKDRSSFGLAIATLVITAFSLVGCAPSSRDATVLAPSDAELVRAQPAATEEDPQDGALVDFKLNFNSLAPASATAVLAKATVAKEFEYLDAEHTFTEIEVVDTLAGTPLDGDTIGVWQIGTAKHPVAGLARPLRTGESYVLFLDRLWFEQGKLTDNWVVVAQGSWIEEDGTYVLDVVTDEDHPLGVEAGAEIPKGVENLVMSLPERSTLDGLTREISSLKLGGSH